MTVLYTSSYSSASNHSPGMSSPSDDGARPKLWKLLPLVYASAALVHVMSKSMSICLAAFHARPGSLFSESNREICDSRAVFHIMVVQPFTRIGIQKLYSPRQFRCLLQSEQSHFRISSCRTRLHPLRAISGSVSCYAPIRCCLFLS